MRFGYCANLQDVPLLENCGYDYVELPVAAVCPHKGEEEFAKVRKQVKSFRIIPEVFNCFIPTDMRIVGPQINLEWVMQYVEVVIRRIAELGGRLIVFGSAGARSIPSSFSYAEAHKQLKEFLIETANHAAANGVTVAIEPLRKKDTNIVNTIEEALDLAKEAGRQEIRVLADLYHITQENEPFSHLIEARSYIAHVHVADGDKRLYPGSSDYDFVGFFTRLKELEYKQRISIECEWSDLAREATKALKFLHDVWGN